MARIDRRDFLKSFVGETATAEGEHSDRLGTVLPMRSLGQTGLKVTMLGVGGWHIGRMSESEALATLETALGGGVRFFDTAESYHNGGSEERLGRLLTPKYRDAVFLMTKTTAKDAESARRHLDGSLRRLKTDYLDLWQVHSVKDPDDVDGRIESGVLEVIEETRASGKARHIGFTGHASPHAHLRMLERTDIFETCQMPINAADPSYSSFIRNVMPVLINRNIGILAMKTLANGGFFGGSQQGEHGDNPRLVPDRLTIQEAVHFAWSLPISVLITGPDDHKQMAEKISLARSFRRMDKGARNALVERVADLAGRVVEFYKS